MHCAFFFMCLPFRKIGTRRAPYCALWNDECWVPGLKLDFSCIPDTGKVQHNDGDLAYLCCVVPFIIINIFIYAFIIRIKTTTFLQFGQVKPSILTSVSPFSFKLRSMLAIFDCMWWSKGSLISYEIGECIFLYSNFSIDQIT